MKRKQRIISAVALSIMIVMVLTAVVIIQTPVASIMTVTNTTGRAACVIGEGETCLTLPSVTGMTINSAEVSFPDAMASGYQLVVMPFDREQQVLAATWLPQFQQLATTYDDVTYWSIAALPELNPAIRLLVMGGISAGVNEAAIRPQITALFLEEQTTFLDAVGVDNTDQIRVFIMDADGIIYYSASGAYTDEGGAALSDALSNLLAS